MTPKQKEELIGKTAEVLRKTSNLEPSAFSVRAIYMITAMLKEYTVEPRLESPEAYEAGVPKIGGDW